MSLRLLVLTLSVGLLQASLRGKIEAHSGSMSVEALRETVLEEVMGALGSGNRVTSQRLSSIEAMLTPTFKAMPKNAYGNLEDAAARYVLHRLFVRRHAMYIKGMEADGMSWNETTTAEVLEDHVPSFVLGLFENRLKEQGLGLHELTVLAATLEHLIHDEAVSRLGVVYQAHGHQKESFVNEVELQDLIDTYMTIFLVGPPDMNATTVAQERAKVVETYPGWGVTRNFTMEVRSNVLANKNSQNFSFSTATEVVEEIGERYGHWQDAECRDLKSLLLKYEKPGTGRVPLKDFYGAALDGNWQFSESMEYLNVLGALDQSDPSNPMVLIPNYVNGKSNCVASSSIYSVCCINECEALLGHLEEEVAAPEATPQRLLDLVSRLPSDTQKAQAPSSALQKRLQDVADQHEGTVPLHGRLFAQWLHHVYPRECPFPHPTGKTNPMTADEWVQVKHQGVAASKEEMKRYKNSQRLEESLLTKESLPWSHEEELVARHKSTRGGFLLKALWILAALGIMSQMLQQSLKAFSKGKELMIPLAHKQHAC